MRAQKKLFTIDDFFSLLQPADRIPLHLSPDGKILLLTVQRSRKATDSDLNQSYTHDGIPKGIKGSRVLMIDTITGNIQDPFPESCTSWGAQWSPDGEKWVAYICDQGQLGLGVWERIHSTFHLLQPIEIHPFFGFEVPSWTSDSQSVVVK